MKIVNKVRVEVPIAEVWMALNDVPRIAHCAPGAVLLGSAGQDCYAGTVSVRFGPVALKFKGTVTFVSRDDAAYRAVARAQADEEKARGTASCDFVFALAADNAGTLISVESDISLAGSIAQYGRGSALVQHTAQVLMDQFAKNFEASLLASKSDGALAPPSPANKEIGLATVLVKGTWNTLKQAVKRSDESASK